MENLFQKFQHYLMTEKCVSENTLAAYTRDIRQFIIFVKKLDPKVQTFKDVTQQHVKDFLKHLKVDLELGPRSSSRKLSALKTLANYLSHYHDHVPFTNGVSFPQLPKQLPKHLTQEQVQELLRTANENQSISGQRNKVMICLLYACGVRVSELVSLKVSNIDFEEKCLHVTGKGGKDRIVPLPEEVTRLLEQYINGILPAILYVNGIQKDSEYLFPVVRGNKVNHITRQQFWKFVKQLAQKSGLIHAISPHVLRHSLATHLLKRGANLRVLQMLLGHEKLNTVQVYTHLEITHLRELYDKYHPRA